MITDPATAVHAAGEARHQLAVALARLRGADTATWAGHAARNYRDARDAVIVTGHAVERELRGAQERLATFAGECRAWTAGPG